MYRVTVRFYEELNFFLPDHRKRRDFDITFPDRRSVKDLVESLNVPHPEIDLILINGESSSFDRIVEDGDRISVYPVFERLDITGVTRLRPKPLRTPRFVVDVHLGSLARKLRLLGFDTVYDTHLDDPELAELSRSENRILLTRDTRLLMRSVVRRGLYIRNTEPKYQIEELIERLDLAGAVKPFSRCVRCNGLISPVDQNSDSLEDLLKEIPSGVKRWCDTYGRCESCGNIYWKGSHINRIVSEFSEILPDVFPDRN
jgi:uncharacterized protein with PIN domain